MGGKSGHRTAFYMMVIVIIFFYIEHGYTQTIEGNLQIKTGSGVPLKNVTSIEENTLIQLVSTYTLTGEDSSPLFELSVKYKPDVNWISQVTCLIRSDGTTQAGNVSDVPEPQRFITAAHMSCEKNVITITRQLNSESPPYFKVEIGTILTKISVLSATATVFTYSKPEQLTVEQIQPSTNLIPREGDEVIYRCSCTARPPPVLRFSYAAGQVPLNELSHFPAIENITVTSPKATSNLTWTTKAIGDMNAQSLNCHIDNHISKREESEDIAMTVTFGPEPKDDIIDEWNLATSDTKEVECSLRCRGCRVYEWYETSESPENKLPDSDSTIQLRKSAFSDISGTETRTVVYICTTINPENYDKTATLSITLNIYISFTTTTPTTSATEIIKTSPGNGDLGPSVDGSVDNSSSTSSLPPWAIVLIVVGCLAIVLAVLAAIWIGVKRRRSPAMKKKKAAAGKKSSGSNYTNEGGDYTTGSQPDIIRNSYRPEQSDIATLSKPDYRYSQHVEDYADVIDDQPRSRKPIQYSMDELNLDGYDNSPPIENGPPGYNTHDYRSYGTAPRDYGRDYGAPC